MSKNIVNYNKGRREYLESLHKLGAFGLSSTIENKDQALFLAALGCDSPVPLSTKKDEGGWFRTESVTKYSKDVALMSSLLLGLAQSDEDFDKYSQLDTYMDYLEQCAENGFLIIEDRLADCNDDVDLLERRMLKELDYLYTSSVENDI